METIIATNSVKIESINALNTRASDLVRSDILKAKTYLWKAKHIGLFLDYKRGLSNTYSQLVSVYQNDAIIDSALFYLNSLEKISKNATFSKDSEADVMNTNFYSTSGLYHKKAGDFKEALVYFKKAYDLLEQLDSAVSSAGQAMNIGNCYLGLSNYNAALEYYLKALRGFEKLGNKKGEAFCFQNIGECYIELGQYQAALNYANKAISLKKEINDVRGLGNAEHTLGMIYAGIGDHDKALKHFTKSLQISEDLKLSNEAMKIHLSMGKIHALKNETDKAISHFKQSKNIAEQLGDKNSVASADMEILATAKEKIISEEIIHMANENIESMRLSGNVSKESAAYKNLADFYLEKKEYKNALFYTDKYHTLNDSIKNIDIQTRFKEIEELYNKEKNEKQIQLLQKDQVIGEQKLKQQRFLLLLAALIVLLISFAVWGFFNRQKHKQRMSELLLRNQIAADLHDEVGSSLSSIYMLSQMAEQMKSDQKDEIISKVGSNAHDVIEKMSDIVWMIKPNENSGSNLRDRMERFIHEYSSIREIEYSFKANDLNGLKLTM
ncbi:MAG: tetratricopeptide repeat protein, partial [Aquaticitalea sp.]